MNKPLYSGGLQRTALVVALLSLGGCASLPGATGPTQSTARAAANASAAPVAITDNSAAAEAAAAAERAAAIADINRDGRTIQLGRFVEEAPPVPQLPNDVVELNYEQEDLRTVFEQLGGVLGLNMVIDPTINTRVSMRTAPGNPLRAADIWPVMRQLARRAGVTIEQVGNVWEFSLNPSNIPTEILLPGDLANATSSEVLQVTPLRYISIEAAETLLSPLLQPPGSVIRLGSGSLLGIYGSPDRLARINALLAAADVDPFQNKGIQLYPLVNSSAAAVAEELKSVLTLIEGEQSSYQVAGLERINAVLVTAPAGRGFEEVTRWMRILDAASQEQGEQLFVYKVRNLTATTLGETLVKVFGEEEDDEDQVQNDPALQGPRITAIAPDGQNVAIPGPFGGFAVTTTPEGTSADIVSGNLSVTIVADEDTNSLLVRASPREYRQLLMTISQLDTVPLQVLINAAIGQVTLSDSQQFGIDWTRISANSRLGVRFLPGTGIDADTGVQNAASGLILERSFMDGNATIDAMLRAIGQDNETNTLARPSVFAMNNQEANINVGASVPVNSGVTLVGNGQSTENITYQDVGILLTITPRINDDGFITLTIEQELSSVQEGVGVASNPVFTKQEINTTVVVADQETVTLGGLIQDDYGDSKAGVPYLQEVPVLGRLFSYSELRKERKELFIIIRPQIIRGDGRDNAQIQAFRESFTHVSELLRDAGL